MSYLGLTLGGSYPSSEVQLVYFTVPANWATYWLANFNNENDISSCSLQFEFLHIVEIFQSQYLIEGLMLSQGLNLNNSFLPFQIDNINMVTNQFLIILRFWNDADTWTKRERWLIGRDGKCESRESVLTAGFGDYYHLNKRRICVIVKTYYF